MIPGLATLDRGTALLSEEIAGGEVTPGSFGRDTARLSGLPTSIYAITETRLLPVNTQRFIEFLREKLRYNYVDPAF
jgi:hypothetical protein